MTVQVFSSGQVVPPFEILDAVANGVLELGFAPGSYWIGKSKAFPLMSSIPFGFAPRDQVRFRRRVDVSRAFEQLLSPRGVVALPCGAFGRPGEMWLRRSLTGPDDLRGLKLRVAGIEADIYRELGASTVLLPVAETYPALERGVIDGARLLSPKADLDLGFPEITRFYYHPGLLTPSVVADLLINRQKWQSLPETGRAILTRACLDATDATLDDSERSDREALAEIVRRSVAVNPVPGQVARAMLAASQKVMGNLGRGDRTVSAVMSIVEQMRPITIAAQLR
jgi:TRAP-type mannitol/chloroaromatic compound transport system substrate-binding protein